MIKDPSNSNRTLLPQATEFRVISEMLQKLSRKVDLPPTEKAEQLQKLLLCLKKIDLAGDIQVVEKEIGTIEESIKKDLELKREQVLQCAEQAGLKTRRYTAFDRIGPVNVVHKGAKTTIQFGKLPLGSFEETSGAKAAERIVAQVRRILEEPFDSGAFYKEFRRAYQHACLECTRQDGWVRLDFIFREIVAGRTRASFGNRIQQEPKTPEPYLLVEFLVDLARLFRNPQYPEGEYIRSRTTPMGLMDQALHVPDLNAPLDSDKPYLDFKIERENAP